MIYFIRGAGQTDVKIGYSANVKGRMADLQVGMPREVELLLAIPGSQRDEKELHLRFRPFHIRGEWFELTSEIVDYIRDQQARDARPWLAKMPAAWSEPGSHHCDGCDLNYTGADAYEHAKVHQEWLDLCAAHGFIRTYLTTRPRWRLERSHGLTSRSGCACARALRRRGSPSRSATATR